MIHKSETSWLMAFLRRTLGQKMGKGFLVNLHGALTKPHYYYHFYIVVIIGLGRG